VLKAKLTGHYQYYGINGNMRLLSRYYWRAVQLAMKWLNRRSQKHSFSWAGFGAYLKHYPCRCRGLSTSSTPSRPQGELD